MLKSYQIKVLYTEPGPFRAIQFSCSGIFRKMRNKIRIEMRALVTFQKLYHN